MKRFAHVIGRGPKNLSACVPGLLGCVTTGNTVEEIERTIREDIELHLEGMAENGDPNPEPSTSVASVELQVA